MGFVDRITARVAAVAKAAVGLTGATEGEFRQGPAQLPVIEACVSAYSQTCAMCPGDHWRANNKGGRDRVTNSALSRILRYPNDYQSMSDFLLNAVRQLYLQGNAYALCLRNARYEIVEL